MSAVHVVDRFTEAYNQKNIELFAACCRDDVVVMGPLGESICDGIEDLHRIYSQVFIDFPDMQIQTIHRSAVGDYVADERCASGIGFALMEEAPAKTVTIYRIDDDLIAHIRLIA